MEILIRYPWPGNVRELRNLVERLVIVCPQARIEPHHLPPSSFVAPPKARTILTPRFMKRAAPTSGNSFSENYRSTVGT